MRTHLMRSLVAAGLVLAGVGMFGPHEPAQAQTSALRGRIEIDGSSTVYPITAAAASAFKEKFPNVDITVAVSGTGGGFERFVVGQTDISDASRPIALGEFKASNRNDIQFIELPVALDGLTVVVNPANDFVDKLTIDQLREIYLARDAAQTWSDVNPAWPDVPIKVFSPGTDSGTFDYFHEVLGEDKPMRPDMATSENDNVLVRGVAGNENAIAYFGASYYFNNQDQLKAVPIVNPKTGEAVLPTPENVQSGTYFPLSRPLFIYVKKSSLRKPAVREFVEFYLKNSEKLAERVDYVGLSEEMKKRALKHFRRRLIGTHYWTESGKAREGTLMQVYTPENLVTDLSGSRAYAIPEG